MEDQQHSVSLADFAPQGDVFDALMRTLREGRFSHAHLICGMKGSGRRTLARCLTQYLMCTGTSKPCGVCPGCAQVLSGNHPDVIYVRAPAGKKSIPVAAVRDAVAAAALTSYEGGSQVVVIEDAEGMNASAQNALLKTLEEPKPGTYFLLTAASTALLLPTIVSRCRITQLHPWPDAAIDGILRARGVDAVRRSDTIRVCGGSIGDALRLSGDEKYWELRREIMDDFFGTEKRSGVITVSDKWRRRVKQEKDSSAGDDAPAPSKTAKKQGDTENRDPAAELLDTLDEMIRELLMVRLSLRDASDAASYPPEWRRMSREASPERFEALAALIRDARRMHASNVTWQAIVEMILLRMMEEKDQWRM